MFEYITEILFILQYLCIEDLALEVSGNCMKITEKLLRELLSGNSEKIREFHVQSAYATPFRIWCKLIGEFLFAYLFDPLGKFCLHICLIHWGCSVCKIHLHFCIHKTFYSINGVPHCMEF